VLVLVAVAAYGITSRQLEHAADLREAEYRAYVQLIADLSVNDHLGWLEIRNVGRTMAEEVKVTFDPPLVGPYDKENDRIADLRLWRGIPSLPPGRSMRTLWGGTVDIAKAAEDGRIPGTITATVSYYSPAVRKRFEDQTVIDLDIYWGIEDVRRKGIDDVAVALGDIKKVLESLRREVNMRR
jgi:hypothetical protein